MLSGFLLVAAKYNPECPLDETNISGNRTQLLCIELGHSDFTYFSCGGKKKPHQNKPTKNLTKLWDLNDQCFNFAPHLKGQN